MSASPAPNITRRVWQEVTSTPSASMETLARRTKCDEMTVFQAICELERLGYIAEPTRPGDIRRRVLVPFAEVL